MKQLYVIYVITDSADSTIKRFATSFQQASEIAKGMDATPKSGCIEIHGPYVPGPDFTSRRRP
jgi:hypothetical protein